MCARLPGFDMVWKCPAQGLFTEAQKVCSVQRVEVLVTVYCFCQIPNSKSIIFHHNLEYSNLESATILYIILYQHISQVRSNSPVTFRFQRVPAGVARKRWPACPGEDDVAAEGKRWHKPHLFQSNQGLSMLAMLNCEKKRRSISPRHPKYHGDVLSITISYFGFVAARYRAYALIFWAIVFRHWTIHARSRLGQAV